MNLEIKRAIRAMILFAILTGCTNTPTQVSSISFTDTPMPIFTPITKSTSTPAFIPTLETEIAVFEESTSPDGLWTGTVILTTQGEYKDLLFKVLNKTTGKEWIIEQIDVDKVESHPPGGFFYPYILKWSQDNNYLYYSYLSTGGDGCFGYFQPGGFGLKRFDLSSGNIVEIRSDWATWMALSPDEKRLAYIADWGESVSILDMENGKEQSYPLPPIKNEVGVITDTSDLYWAPDGKSLVYVHYVGVCDLVVPISYIIQLFPVSGQQNILVSQSEEGLYPIEWNVQDKVLLQNFNDGRFWLDLSTKEITPTN